MRNVECGMATDAGYSQRELRLTLRMASHGGVILAPAVLPFPLALHASVHRTTPSSL